MSGATGMARLVEEALELLGDEEPAMRARLLAVLAAELTYLEAMGCPARDVQPLAVAVGGDKHMITLGNDRLRIGLLECDARHAVLQPG